MLWLLLGVKLRLMVRSLLRGSKIQNVVGVIVLVGLLAPVWLGLGAAARLAVGRQGAAGAVAVLGTVHFGWLVSAFLFSAFAEGLELRALLRYPVRPSVVFVINVLLAPCDLVALFLVPPLLAAVVAANRLRGAGAAAGLALAYLLAVLMTGVVLHMLLAALGRFLRRDWSRAVAGLVLGLAFATPTLALQRYITSKDRQTSAATIAAGVPRAAWLAARVPTSAFPAMMARAAFAGDGAGFALGLGGAVMLLGAGVALGTRWSSAAALDSESFAGIRSRARSAITHEGSPARGASRPRSLAERVLGAALAVLVGRELRYWLRTPQVLLGLLFTPLLVLMFFYQPALPVGMAAFFMPFFCLISVFNLSANQFGLDREGVRLLLLLPIAPAQLVAAKNLAAFVVAATATAVSLVLVHTVHGLPWLDLARPALSVLASLPAVLIAGNELSTRHPWRMTFKVGGTPPGAMTSALLQFVVVALMAVLLALPRGLGWLLDAPWLASAGTLALGALTWALWAASLPGAARRLVRRQERLLQTLAYPHETG
jgi:hypothetical protein